MRNDIYGDSSSVIINKSVRAGSKSISDRLLILLIIQNIVYNLKVFLVLYYSNYICYFNLYLILKRQPTDTDLVIVHWR